MKVSTITTPNPKGQIVIPRRMREALGITPDVPLNITLRGNGIYIHPVREVVVAGERKEAYLKILEKTMGSWKGDDWVKTEKRRRRIELSASRRRRQQW